MGTFSIRPNVSLNLYMSKTDDAGNNRSLVSWDLQLNETAEQPSFNLTANNTASVSFSWWNGSTAPTIANYTFDFRPTGLQNFSIGSGSFYVTHQSNGVGGTVTGSASAAAPNSSSVLGTATAGASVGLTDYNRSPAFTTSSAPSPAIRGNSYTGQFTATNTSSYSQTGTLPPGLTFNTSTGALTGTPTTLGTYSFTITANGSFEGSASVSRTVVVNPPAPVFSDSTIAGIAIRGVAYSDGVAASDAGYNVVSPATPYSLGSGTLPTGLAFNTSTGAITGTPTTLQSRSIVFRATNVTGSTDTPARSLVVNPPAPVFSDSTLVLQASIGSSYSDAVFASDVDTYSVFSGELPPGLTLNTLTGVVSGTPTTAGEYPFVLRATNVTGSTDTAEITITIISPVRVWVGPDDDDFVIGSLKIWVGPDDDDFVNGVVRVWNGNQFASAK